MPSFDIVSEIDLQKLDNAINVARKEIIGRYDFNNSKTTIELDKKTMVVQVVTEDNMKMDAVEGIMISRMMKQGLDGRALDFGKEHYASGSMIRKDITIKQGIDKEVSRKILKVIKDSGLKVQPSIMDDQVRVTGKKIDDLQSCMATLRQTDFEIALQFKNFK